MNRFGFALLFCSLLAESLIAQPANHVVISEVYGGGGNSGATLKNDFIELYNPTDSTISVAGWSVQYASATGSSWTNITPLQGSIAPKSFFLIQEAAGSGGTQSLPTPDVTGSLALSGTAGKVALAKKTTGISGKSDPDVVDYVGYGSTANEYEGTGPTPAPSNTSSIERKASSTSTTATMSAGGTEEAAGNGYDSNNNASDFITRTPEPQNSSSPKEPRGSGPQAGSGAVVITPGRWKFSTPTTLQLTFTPTTDTVRALKIKKPSLFQMAQQDVSVVPASARLSFSGDTLLIGNILLSLTDTLTVIVQSTTATDSTDEFAFEVSTSKDTATFLPIQSFPRTLVYGTPRSIAQVKAKLGNGVSTLLSKWAVVRGVITAANEFGGPSYLQDATAGMAVYDSSVSNNVQRGDDVIMLGKVAPFNELFEFAPCTLLQKAGEGVTFDTTLVTIPQIKSQAQSGVESYEARLIKVNNITTVTSTTGTPVTAWNVTGSGTNYWLFVGTDTLEVRISPKTNIANLPIPVGKFDLIGVLSQYNTFYQIQPRSIDDIIVEGNGPRFLSQPVLTTITPTALTFAWTTDVAGTSTVNYGTTTTYGTTVTDTNQVTNHVLAVSGLKPATIYQVQFSSTNAGGMTLMGNTIVSTASQSSTGTMNVYFNKSVNNALARGENAQTVNIYTKLVSRINAATYSIDAALYSLSGNVGASVANALVSAKQRGVKVRVIGENDNKTTVPWTTLATNGITVIFDTFDATNAGAGLMHNKFVVVDNRDTTSDTDDWVWSGSWNATDPGNDNDAQNVIEIQDKALANAYTVEFSEMWGSDSLTPNAAASRFGARKLDNTPHQFMVAGTPVELYFSPSDRTTNQIIRTLNKATHSIDFALLTFTRNDIANAVIAKKTSGLKVHGVVDNRTDQGSEFDTLAARGVDVHLKGAALSGLLHHKYGLVDAEATTPAQFVITGSHNWSSSAENANNENTLIIQSARIANLYLQEFASRYAEAGGTDILTNVEPVSEERPATFGLMQNYPNPFNPTTHFQFSIPARPAGGANLQFVKLCVFDLLGRKVAVLVNEEKPAGTYRVSFDASKLSSGIYFYTLKAGTFVSTRKMILLK